MRYLFLCLLLMSFPLFATSYGEPKRREVFSFNSKYSIIVDPVTQVHKIYKVADRSKALWSFKKPVWHYPFVISNDGSTVATVSWRHVQAKSPIKDSTALQFWQNGKKWKTHTFKTVFPNPPKTQDAGLGPIGDFWRTWYSDIAIHDNQFSLKLTNAKTISFSLATGEQLQQPAENIFPKQQENAIVEIELPDLDSDNDGISDALEIRHKLNPKVADSKIDADKDGFRNIDEVKHDTAWQDAKDHPPLIFRCRVQSIQEDEVTIFDELNKRKFRVQKNETFVLTDTLKNKEFYQLSIIKKNSVQIIYDAHKTIYVLKSKALLPAPEEWKKNEK